ncbi:MAG: flagellar FlbD family protein [Lachnospiraceae bacterium]|nr:flagellar FlbD family protein [Lachnospiraceae bacterium]
MILVNRLNGKELIINCDMIETIEATPDTVITLVNGHKYVVVQGVDEIRDSVIAYKRRLYTEGKTDI